MPYHYYKFVMLKMFCCCVYLIRQLICIGILVLIYIYKELKVLSPSNYLPMYQIIEFTFFNLVFCMLSATFRCKRLLRSMREDYRNRAGYVAYLIRCRQGLLATKSQLQRLINRITRSVTWMFSGHEHHEIMWMSLLCFLTHTWLF